MHSTILLLLAAAAFYDTDAAFVPRLRQLQPAGAAAFRSARSYGTRASPHFESSGPGNFAQMGVSPREELTAWRTHYEPKVVASTPKKSLLLVKTHDMEAPTYKKPVMVMLRKDGTEQEVDEHLEHLDALRRFTPQVANTDPMRKMYVPGAVIDTKHHPQSYKVGVALQPMLNTHNGDSQFTGPVKERLAIHGGEALLSEVSRSALHLTEHELIPVMRDMMSAIIAKHEASKHTKILLPGLDDYVVYNVGGVLRCYYHGASNPFAKEVARNNGRELALHLEVSHLAQLWRSLVQKDAVGYAHHSRRLQPAVSHELESILHDMSSGKFGTVEQVMAHPYFERYSLVY